MAKKWLRSVDAAVPLGLLILGGPGTGKTEMVNLAKEFIARWMGPGVTEQCAFMHSAARLVDGITLNSALAVPTVPLHGKNKSLGKRKADLLLQWRHKLALFLDEISMVALELLGRSEYRARQVKKEETRSWGGLAVVGSGDLDQLPPVQQTSVADPVRPPPEPLTVTQRLAWETEHAEAIAGRRVWEGFTQCIFLEYSQRCSGLLHGILTEMMRPNAQLSPSFWEALQARVVGHAPDPGTGKPRRQVGFVRDPRLDMAPFNSGACRIGVLRHTVRAVKVMDHAKLAAAEAGKRLLLVVAADRAGAGSKDLHVPLQLYRRFTANPRPSETKYLAGVLPLFCGAQVVLEEKECARLGIVRGCQCRVADIIFDPKEPAFDDDPNLPPHVLRRVPVGVVLTVLPGASWVKDPLLGRGRFFVGRKRRTWRYLLKDEADIEFVLDTKGGRYVPVERLQIPVSCAAVLTAYGLQGTTVDGIFLDLKRPPGMTRDEHWMACYVLLSRARTLDQVLIYRLCRKAHLEGGPPQHIQAEKVRLRVIEKQTLEHLDRALADAKLHQTRVNVSIPLLEEIRRRVPVPADETTMGASAASSVLKTPVPQRHQSKSSSSRTTKTSLFAGKLPTSGRTKSLREATVPSSSSTLAPAPVVRPGPSSVPIGAGRSSWFFERQHGGGHCGRHALNHVLQRAFFTPAMMSSACDWIIEESEYPDHQSAAAIPARRRDHERSDGSGWYSDQVLAQALLANTEFRWHHTPLHVNPDVLTLPCTAGAVVNQDNRHWVALRWDAREHRVCLLNSTAPRPSFMSVADYHAFLARYRESYAIINYEALG